MKFGDDISDILAYYKKNQEGQRSTTQQLEFSITFMLLQKYLPPRSKILELGAGVGFYTAQLALQGHLVTAVEPVAELVQTGKEILTKLNLQSQVTWQNKDARTFEAQPEHYDAVLIMGPLYHLIKKEDRIQVIEKAASSLKHQGLLFSAWLSRAGFLTYLLARQPGFIQQHQLIDEVMAHGHYLNHPRDGSFRGYFAEKNEMAELPKGFESVGLFCQDPCIGGLDDIFNLLPPNLKDEWTKYLFTQCHKPDLIGSGRSVMSITRKKEIK